MFEAYAHAVLLFGIPLWGVHVLDPKGRVACDCTGELGAFYRKHTWMLLGVSLDTHNSTTYVLAAKHPLSVYKTKSVSQYAQFWKSCGRLVTGITRCVLKIDIGNKQNELTITKMQNICDTYNDLG